MGDGVPVRDRDQGRDLSAGPLLTSRSSASRSTSRALPIAEIIIALSLAAMFIASLIAVFETNLKRMLAYSSVAQIGYITLGIGLANQAGLTGGLVHVVNHALMKAALFLAVGAIFYRACTVQLEELAGIGRKMPLTMAAFTIAGFGLVGTPGTVRLHLQMVSGGRRARQRLVAAGRPDRRELADRACLCRPRPRSGLAARAFAGDRARQRPAASMLLPAHRLGCRHDLFRLRHRMDRGHRQHGRQGAARGPAMTPFARPKASCSVRCSSRSSARCVIPLFHNQPNLREAVTLVTAGCFASPSFGLLAPVLGGARPRACRSFEVAPGLALAFKVEPLGMLFALVASSLWIVNSIYSIGYMRGNDEPRQTGFYVCFAARAGEHDGRRVRREPVHAVPVLRSADALDLSRW